MKSTLASLSLVLCLTWGAGAAETAVSSTGENVIFHSGDTVEVPMVLTTDDTLQPRTITFPGVVTEWPQGIPLSNIQLQPLRNTLTIWLKDPSWSGIIQVGDDTGSVYRLRIRHAGEGELPDPSLTLTLAGDSSIQAEADPRANYPTDTDSAAVILERAMNSRRVPDSITVAPVTSVGEDKKTLPYSVGFADDLLEIRLLRIWTAPNLKGYECAYVWKGEKAVAMDYRRLKFANEISIHAPTAKLIRGGASVIVMEPGMPVPVYHICTP